ncbi:hypothetical protein ABPG75_008135 [Micractinium tetrahymenae]
MWTGPHCRYSCGGGAPAATAAATAVAPPPPSPRYLAAFSPPAAPAASPTAAASPWGQGSDAGSSGAHSPGATSTAAADDEQLQSLVSALRVVLGKKEAALVSVAGQLADAQGRLTGCDAERRRLEARLRELEPAAAGRLPSSGLSPEGRLLAQARQELGQEAARAAELAADRDALQRDVALLQQQLTAAAQAEALERERLCTEAAQSRLLARARARQVEQLQTELRQAAGACSSAGAAAAQEAQAAAAEAATVKAAAAKADARTAAAEANAARLQQQLEAAQAAQGAAEARASQAEAELADARQQAEWQALRINELEQTSSVGQLMRRYEAEVQRLRAQHESELRDLHDQLGQARTQQAEQQAQWLQQVQQPQRMVASSLPDQASNTPAGLDSAAWAALFEEPSGSPLAAASELQDACVQTEHPQQEEQKQQQPAADPALLEAARLEIERLQQLNAGLLASHSQVALKEELDAVGEMVRAAEVEHLQAQLQQAVAQTASLEAQVQQLKADAATVAQQHAAAVQQQEQRGAAAAETQVASAVQAAADRHEQQVCALQAQLAEARQQLQETRTALSELVHEQLLRRESMQDTAVQACCVADRAAAQSRAMQTEEGWRPGFPVSIVQIAAAATERQTADSGLPSAWAELGFRGSMCESQQLPSGSGRSSSKLAGPAAGSPSVAETAKQLQLELAKVRIAPAMRPLPGCGRLRAGSRQAHPPSRLASAFGEHTVLDSSTAPTGSYLGNASGGGSQSCGRAGNKLLLDEDEEEGFATPLAATPAAQSPELLPGAGKLQHGNATASAAAGWGSMQHPAPGAADAWVPAEHQQRLHQQQQQAGRAGVPPLNLRLVRPYSSLSCDSISPCSPGPQRSTLSSPLLPQPEASASVSSLSSLGPSASLLAGSLPAAAAGGSSSTFAPRLTLHITDREQAAHRPRKVFITITLDSTGHVAAANTSVSSGDRRSAATDTQQTSFGVESEQGHGQAVYVEDGTFWWRLQQRAVEKYAAAAGAMRRLWAPTPCPLAQEAAASAVVERQPSSAALADKWRGKQQPAGRASRKALPGGQEIEIEITL